MDVPQIFGTSWMFSSKLPYSFDNIQSQSETCESLTISRCVWAARNDRTWKVGKRGKFSNFAKPERWGCEGRGRSGIDGLVITFIASLSIIALTRVDSQRKQIFLPWKNSSFRRTNSWDVITCRSRLIVMRGSKGWLECKGKNRIFFSPRIS